MPRTSNFCRTHQSRRIGSRAVKPWRGSSLFSSVSAFNRLPKRFTPTNAQTWDYDAVGNWDSVTTNSTTQTRGANRQNEITSVNGATTPTYDNNGNLTKDENDFRFVYDAWNRQTKIKNSSNTVIATNAFDGLNRKVQVTTSAGLIDKIFGKNDWQVFEEKNGSNALNRYVWSPVYVDGLVTRDRDTDANGTLDERLFALQDANWNVTGITNTSGTIQERYTEGPFGIPTIRDGAGSPISVSTKGWDILHQGAKADIIGNFDFRNRILSPTLGRWLTNDPIGFSAGDVNTYRYVGNGPGNRLDPLGLADYFGELIDIPEEKTGRKLTISHRWTAKGKTNQIIKWGVYRGENEGEEKNKEINGYIIQEIIRNYKFIEAPKENFKIEDLKIKYYEAWEVRNGKVIGETDTWQIVGINNSRGELTMKGDARFFYKDKHNFDFYKQWQPINKSIDIDRIKIRYTSGSLKGSDDPPPFWNQGSDLNQVIRTWEPTWDLTDGMNIFKPGDMKVK